MMRMQIFAMNVASVTLALTRIGNSTAPNSPVLLAAFLVPAKTTPALSSHPHMAWPLNRRLRLP